jgi:hypothetical protein
MSGCIQLHILPQPLRLREPKDQDFLERMMCRFMVKSAMEEGRVILTCDRLFFTRRLSEQAFFVQGKDKQAQVIRAAFQRATKRKLLSVGVYHVHTIVNLSWSLKF